MIKIPANFKNLPILYETSTELVKFEGGNTARIGLVQGVSKNMYYRSWEDSSRKSPQKNLRLPNFATDRLQSFKRNVK